MEVDPATDDTMTANESANSQSLFLNLPRELRNRIYEFAVEDCTRPLILRDSRRCRQDLCRKCEGRHKRMNAVTKRWYYGLTQVCRQIRTEYLPLYRSTTKTHLTLDKAHDYIKTLIEISGRSPDEIVGKIVFLATCLLDKNKEFDVLALARQEAMAPGLTISSALSATRLNCGLGRTFEYNVAEEFVVPLLNSTRYPKLSTYVEGKVSAITWSNERGRVFTLHICMKKGVDLPSPPWQDPQFDEQWLLELGLYPKMEVWNFPRWISFSAEV